MSAPAHPTKDTMRFPVSTLLAGLLLSACALAQASDWKDSAAVGKLFKKAGVSGTFVLHDIEADSYTVYNLARAKTRYAPASTFKLANTLIGLTVGAVADVDEALPYGGKPLARKEWEHDMSLRQAMPVSNLRIYQELARRIGAERMRTQLTTLNYGNMQTGKAIDSFWLEGPLQISALEQTGFIERLAQDRLPFPREAMAQTRDIAELERTPAYTLYGKTGWSSPADGKDLGWWVGWLQKDGRLYSFALNLDIRRERDAEQRVPLGRASLKALGLL